MSFCFRTFVRKHRTSRGHLSASIRLLAGILFKYSASVVCPQGIRHTSATLRPAPTPPFFIILVILNILQYHYVHIHRVKFVEFLYSLFPISHIIKPFKVIKQDTLSKSFPALLCKALPPKLIILTINHACARFFTCKALIRQSFICCCRGKTSRSSQHRSL